MMESRLFNGIFRGFQILFATVVLALAVVLIRGQADFATVPASLNYSAFVGGWTLLMAFICIGLEFFPSQPLKIAMVLDGLTFVFNLAGGAMLAKIIDGIKCSDTSAFNKFRMENNELFNGGCAFFGKIEFCGYTADGPGEDKMFERCKESQAASVFMFLTLIFLLLSAVRLFFKSK